jgi:hypothetical protein
MAENHVGMEKLGELASSGFQLDDLMKAKRWFEEEGVQCELIHLNGFLDGDVIADDAYLLIARQGLSRLLDNEDGANKFYDEQDALEKDTRAFMYGRVVNKHARHNLCFGPTDQDANYEHKKGTVVSFDRVPLLNAVRKKLPEVMGDIANDLVAEGNYYFDVKKCGIGYHGDSERRKVVGVRVGASIPLAMAWFHQKRNITEPVLFHINHGDVYFFSEKATGCDWKRSSVPTLRHAAGAKKFIQVKK